MCRTGSIKVGDRFGRLQVTKPTKFRYFSNKVWECQCSCGNKVLVSAGNLVTGNTRSCGCLKTEWASVRTIFSNRSNSTGYRGVYRNPKTNKYYARLTSEGHTYNLGTYAKITDAIKARRRAEEEYHFPRMEAYEKYRVGA